MPSRFFWGGILFVAILSLGLRFWGLERFNTYVFDEIYFAKFALNYLTNTPFFDAHPPLGKYLIALGIYLQGFNTWGFRWVNALVGAAIPLLGIAIAYEISEQRFFALLTGFLLSLDGLLLVESRYALINIHLLFFGLTGQLCLLKATRSSNRAKAIWFVLASLLFGATISVKWNGLGLLLGFHLLWLIYHLMQSLQNQFSLTTGHPSLTDGLSSQLQRFSNLSFQWLFIYLPLLALSFYGMTWVPHLFQNHDYSLVQLNIEMFKYHAGVGSGIETHRYCSTWSTWPLMLKPVSYFFQVSQSPLEPLPVNGPTLPIEAAQLYTSVYAMGNPILWWAATAALLWSGFTAIGMLIKCIDPKHQQQWPNTLQALMMLFLGVNYMSNLLPWALISRCAFIYHYMPANFFGIMALAWKLTKLLKRNHSKAKIIAIATVISIILGFLFWLPFWLGIPISPEAWQLRIWLQSWI